MSDSVRELEELKEELESQAESDDIDLYAAVRRSDVGVESPDMKASGLRLWLENNGVEVLDVAENGYIRVVPEDTQ